MANPEDAYTRLSPGGDNAIAVTLGVLGDEWNLWILRHAIAGTRRYCDWFAHGTISHSVLTARLAGLTASGALVRQPYQQRPERFEYVLTERGRSVWPILLAMWAWEQQWSPDAGTALPRMHHRICDSDFVPLLICRACGKSVRRTDIPTSLGPSGDWSRSVPASIDRRRSARARHPAQFLPHTMELLGNRWSAAILGALFLGAARFVDFSRRTSAPPSIVADRLARFARLGVVETRASRERSDWPTYHLTAKGEAFFPAIAMMIDWGQHWFRAPEGPALILRHRSCGNGFRPELHCGACARPLHGRDIDIL
ncbi:helix-turn-helix domain-containing protein [Gordonia sp. ABSL11-1]|uniref:winged helix-turn-helix transcriptional regulator n=1 Tax=Gordonia sp. ABSL11-1 TaxID=3053924 RepID=UPI0025727D30|nr:helix-turn-helix domain-containing protein [Gordonia sp. ABSL11-1]MDL9948128.1 helix-turn-helix domain-containing protein [Gordonia sp. ABSL11-1]